MYLTLFLKVWNLHFIKDDLVIVQKCKIKELKRGDIITFRQNDRIISHRIFGITKDKRRGGNL